MENVTEDIDPVLDPVLEKVVVRAGRTLQILINEKPHEYNEDFKLYMTSMLPSPNFSPELYAKCTVIDFTVTMTGLEQQLLGRVIGQEKVASASLHTSFEGRVLTFVRGTPDVLLAKLCGGISGTRPNGTAGVMQSLWSADMFVPEEWQGCATPSRGGGGSRANRQRF